MALTIDQLKAAFKQPTQTSNRPNNYYPFWDIQVGEQAVVRFLPDKDENNPMGFMCEKEMHTLTINGENKSVPCLKMYGEECPICKVSAAYYKDGDKTNGKKFWRKKQHIAQALIMSDPLPADADSGETHEGKVRFLALGYQIYTVIKEAFEGGELEEIPFAYEGGCNFIIKKTQQGDYPTYAVGSNFARRSTDLTDAEIIVAEEDSIQLNTLLPAHPGLETVEAMLEAALTGSEYSAGTAPAAHEPAQSGGQSTPVATNDDDDADSVAADAILAKIRARNQG